MKIFYTTQNVVSAKYVVSFHNGSKKHKDGSPLYDNKIFNNKIDLKKFTKDLIVKGFLRGIK